MAVNEKLADRVREILASEKRVQEKKMFSGLGFMVNGKMCVCMSDDEMMCPIGPHNLDTALEVEGCCPMIHNGRVMKGSAFIREGDNKNHIINSTIGLNCR